MNKIEFIKDEVWRHHSSFAIQCCEFSGTKIWPWETAMQGVSTSIIMDSGSDGTHMSLETNIRWLTHKNHLMLKLAGKIT